MAKSPRSRSSRASKREEPPSKRTAPRSSRRLSKEAAQPKKSRPSSARAKETPATTDNNKKRRNSAKQGRHTPTNTSSSSRVRMTAADREYMEAQSDRALTKNIILAAVAITALMIGGIVVRTLMVNASFDAVKNLNYGDRKTFKEHMLNAHITSFASYENTAVSKCIAALEEQAADTDSEQAKKKFIACIAKAFHLKRGNLSTSLDAISCLKGLINSQSGAVRNFSVQALGFIIGGKSELEHLIKSPDVNTATSLLAIHSLSKSKEQKEGKIKGSVLVIALKKQDDEFIAQILPLILKNIGNFKREPDAIKFVFNTIQSANKDNTKVAIDILSQCIYESTHYKVLMNKCQSKNVAISNAAFNTLVKLEPTAAQTHWASLLSTNIPEKQKLRLLKALSTSQCQEQYKAVIPLLNANSIPLVLGALESVGKMGNPPARGLTEVSLKVASENTAIKAAAIKSIGGFHFKPPYHYAKEAKDIPSFELIKILNSADQSNVSAVMHALKAINKKKYTTKGEWNNWWKGEKIALELLIKMENKNTLIQSFLKEREFKEALTAHEEQASYFNLLRSKHTNRWKGFSKYLKRRGRKYSEAKRLILKFKQL